MEFKLQKIITRKILIVGKNFTYKKSLRISFSIEKKIKKGVYKIDGWDSVNFCRRQKFYFKKSFRISFSIEKKN